MGYEIHLRRDAAHITETEWTAAVEQVASLRMTQSAFQLATNPRTGGVIKIAIDPLTAEFLFPADYEDKELRGSWLPIFRYFRGAVRVNAGFEVNNPADPVRQALAMLANILGASVVGDGGERYNGDAVDLPRGSIDWRA